VSVQARPEWFELVSPVVQTIVRKKLRVSLSDRDGGRTNQDALDVVQNVYRELAESLTGEDFVKDLKSYAAVVTYHACAQYLRELYPARARLKNKIRYFLSHDPGFAIWQPPGGDWLCALAGQAGAAAPMEAVNALKMDPTGLSLPSLDSMKAEDWRRLLGGIFHALAGFVELDDLVSVIGTLCRVAGEPGEATVEPSVKLAVENQVDQRDMMKRLWNVLVDFDHRWLMAFFLNLPGHTREARGEIEAFEQSGAATRWEIGRLLALTRQEYQDLGRSKPAWPRDPGDPEERFGLLWPHLPLEDVVIAAALECQKQQVINLRAVAVQKAARRLKDLIGTRSTPVSRP
jgi:hypothetical protein